MTSCLAVLGTRPVDPASRAARRRRGALARAPPPSRRRASTRQALPAGRAPRPSGYVGGSNRASRARPGRLSTIWVVEASRDRGCFASPGLDARASGGGVFRSVRPSSAIPAEHESAQGADEGDARSDRRALRAARQGALDPRRLQVDQLCTTCGTAEAKPPRPPTAIFLAEADVRARRTGRPTSGGENGQTCSRLAGDGHPAGITPRVRARGWPGLGTGSPRASTRAPELAAGRGLHLFSVRS